MEGNRGDIWDIAENTNLKFYTEREEVGYLTRNHNKLHWHERVMELGFRVGVLEIVSRHNG